jgi:ribonuclease PH
VSASRPSGRRADELRAVTIELDAAPQAEGSCLISLGLTRVLCTASVQAGVPPWREEIGGWVTAEYAMLPRSTGQRTPRERSGPRARTQEIQRLIGRALRATIDLQALGPRTIIVDCDVLGADGGTRAAAITGGSLALWLAAAGLVRAGELASNPVRQLVSAVSVGIVHGVPCLDLDYAEDVGAGVDMNFAALEDGGIVEVQGTAEGNPFSRDDLDRLLGLAQTGVESLFRHQRDALGRVT